MLTVNNDNMASKKQIEFTGRISNIILYRWRDKNCMRTMPVTVRQTDATKRAATNFGRACSVSRILRKSLSPLLPDQKESVMRIGLNTALLKWLRIYDPVIPATDLPFIRLFSFSKPGWITSLKKYVSVNWETAGKVIINILGFTLPTDLAAPKNTKSVLFQLALTGCKIDTAEGIPYQSRKIDFSYIDSTIPGSSIEFDMYNEPGVLYMVVLSIRYKILMENEMVFCEDEKWMPVSVMGSCFRP
jgi:hypothetical protein